MNTTTPYEVGMLVSHAKEMRPILRAGEEVTVLDKLRGQWYSGIVLRSKGMAIRVRLVDGKEFTTNSELVRRKKHET